MFVAGEPEDVFELPDNCHSRNGNDKRQNGKNPPHSGNETFTIME